ncbi:MAG: VanZ family protein [Pelagibacterales bacterium]|nr:VanZ family protein [Pelagibacterales bacterium]
MNKKILNWLLVFVWAGIIFFLSHQSDLKSNLPSEYDFILRKLAHIFEYAILTFLLIRALSQYKISKKRILLFSVFLAVLYSFSDEYHQSFIFKRTGAFHDVGIDSIGIFLVWLRQRKMLK